jgi:hypothetical protein
MNMGLDSCALDKPASGQAQETLSTTTIVPVGACLASAARPLDDESHASKRLINASKRA